MSDDSHFLLYERLHFWEIDLRDRINGRLPVLLGIVLALVGFESFLINRMLPMQKTAIDYVIGGFLLGSLVCLFVSVYHLVRSWHGMKYALLPTAQRLEEKRVEFGEYCASLSDCDDVEQCLATETQRDLFQLYVICGSQNHELNKMKSFRLHRAFNWILGSLGFAVATYMLLTIAAGVWKAID